MPSHIEWLVWRPVVSKVATLMEVETHYSLSDLMDVNEALDLQDQANRAASKKQE